MEHKGDYQTAVAMARTEAAAVRGYFIDDETSLRLFLGYAQGGRELAQQLRSQKLQISERRPLVVYLPCGIGGAPGGITAGLYEVFRNALLPVFVEPLACRSIQLALTTGRLHSVYDFGLDNKTIADGLAVPTASALALEKVGPKIAAAVAVSDDALVRWVRQAWKEGSLRLEPSAAAGFAGVEPFLAARAARGDPVGDAVHVVWTTGGSELPESEFQALLR